MASKVIYMDGIATAHLRADGSVRIELAAGQGYTRASESLAAALGAVERKLPRAMKAMPLTGPRLAGAPDISLEAPSTPAALADRAS